MLSVNQIELRRPDAGDLPAIRQLLADCGLPTADLSLALLAHFRVARQNGGMVGVAGIEPVGQVGLLRSMAVSPLQRGTGLGCSLLLQMETLAERLKLDSLYLLTTRAADFFSRHGYTAQAREEVPSALCATAEFSRQCPASALCLYKHLRKSAS